MPSATKNGVRKSIKPSTDWLGLDTETIDGYARLIGLSDGRLFYPKNSADILLFLSGFLKAKPTYFFAWNADYDIQALLKYFPKKIVNKFLMGVEFSMESKKGAFVVQYIKGKYFRFGDNYIFDAYQYYHSKLKDAAEKYLGERKGDGLS